MGEMGRLVRSFGYAIEGIIYTIKTQRNMQIHVGVAIMVLLASWLLNISWDHVLLVFFSIFLVLILEMVNTAVEATVDLVTPEYHPLAKVAKDVAAGAVLLAAILSLIVGCYVFGGPLLQVLHI
ncbi:diacylglycerol kinase [Ammoniphilus sp. CFH 90114]|uniref:diacylglycerol kinase n=1 Tax=Ammoniphilus sp. CFH 90114 TaxID=2493665 RepID=UPI00100F837D|nr:diacylglycerol kinase family protein [Ammoniphilus sp. CFH 90114]RXT14838.1 diacylglycerol kinase family protein [Ammoniphilus sp. CFH 90114]